MTSTTRRLLAALGAVTLGGSLAACTVADGFGRDPGDLATQIREITEVSAVILSTSGTMDLSVGEPSLTITAGERVLDAIETEIVGDTLQISLPRWFNPGSIHYDLVLPGLDEVELRGSGTITGTIADTEHVELAVSGSGDIRLEPVTAESLELTVSGSGTVWFEDVTAEQLRAEITGSGSIELGGQATTLDFRVPGSGQLTATDLRVRDASIDIRGSGSARVHVTETLDVRIAGSGAVRHTGGAQVTQSISGSGSVERS